MCPGTQAVSNQVSLSASERRLCSRVSAVTTRACQLLLFVTFFLSDTRDRGVGEEGEQVPVDILTPLPSPQSPQSPLVPAEGRLARLEPSPRRPAAGCSTVGNTLLSPTPHKSFSDTPVSDNSINNTSALSPVAGLVNVGHRAGSSPGGLLTRRQGRHSLPRERMAKLFGPGFTLLPRPTDKCPAWSN